MAKKGETMPRKAIGKSPNSQSPAKWNNMPALPAFFLWLSAKPAPPPLGWHTAAVGCNRLRWGSAHAPREWCWNCFGSPGHVVPGWPPPSHRRPGSGVLLSLGYTAPAWETLRWGSGSHSLQLSGPWRHPAPRWESSDAPHGIAGE